jgi:hypothetical protein
MLAASHAQTRTFTAELLVPVRGALPEGWTEERLDLLGASAVSRRAIDAGYATNGYASRVGETLLDPEQQQPPARVLLFQADGVRVDAAAAVQVEMTQAAPGRWEGTVPGVVVAPVVLELNHGLNTDDVVVTLFDDAGTEQHPQATVPITASAVEVVVGPGTRRVVLQAASDATPSD